jgi:protein-S-isoprenylcysteine O-methyltransferase Ste14
MKQLSKGNLFRILMWILMLIGGGILSIYFDKIYFYKWFNSLTFHIITLIPGYILLKIVLKISRNTGKYLSMEGREGNIPRLQTNKLVTTGIYACMRHPMHLGLWFFPLAFALLLGSPTFIFILAPVEMLLMIILIKLIEEPEAEKKFGEAYRKYKKEVPFFSFKKDCLQELLKD